MASMTDCHCRNCGQLFKARTADVKRGWAKFCSKSCKAVAQERRTGQHRAHLNRIERIEDGGEETFSNAHQFDNTELGVD